MFFSSLMRRRLSRTFLAPSSLLESRSRNLSGPYCSKTSFTLFQVSKMYPLEGIVLKVSKKMSGRLFAISFIISFETRPGPWAFPVGSLSMAHVSSDQEKSGIGFVNVGCRFMLTSVDKRLESQSMVGRGGKTACYLGFYYIIHCWKTVSYPLDDQF